MRDVAWLAHAVSRHPPQVVRGESDRLLPRVAGSAEETVRAVVLPQTAGFGCIAVRLVAGRAGDGSVQGLPAAGIELREPGGSPDGPILLPGAMERGTGMARLAQRRPGVSPRILSPVNGVAVAAAFRRPRPFSPVGFPAHPLVAPEAAFFLPCPRGQQRRVRGREMDLVARPADDLARDVRRTLLAGLIDDFRLDTVVEGAADA